MYQTPIKYHQAIAAAELWIKAGGKKQIELGALEPTLWRDGNKKIQDLISGLVELGCKVNLTTNGSTLKSYAQAFKESKLNLLRISWHSTDEKIFREISGGHGNYTVFYDGIVAASEQKIPISFNKVLLQKTAADLETQLDFIQKYNCKIKLYDLLWTDEIADIYEDNYVDWRKPIKDYVIPRTEKIERKKDTIGRTRLNFFLKGGGIAEVKMGDSVDRSAQPCYSCTHKQNCLEAFTDYARIDSSLNFYSCYLRRDLGFSAIPFVNTQDTKGFQNSIQQMMGENAQDFLQQTSLRFTIMPACNFNCRMPGTTQSWCMEMNDNYRYPKIKPSIF